MTFDRQSGVFLHLTSLPGPHGIGDLGAGAHEFLDFLERADQSLWQFCPVGPTTAVQGHSPYSSPSAFAGNPLLVDLHALADRGWLRETELDGPATAGRSTVRYDAVAEFKRDRLRTAYERFDTETADDVEGRAAFETFREREGAWLDDYTLYRALKTEFDDDPWTEWPRELRHRDPDALARYRERLADRCRYHAFVQWQFDEQWRDLRHVAAERDVTLVGDVPMYVALDSADIWANQDVFAIEDGHPAVVAGVPPNPGDDGQRWGMPVYDWDHLAETDYEWWIDRFDRLFDLVDLARLDHFKAFQEYWAIPAAADDPAAGEWRAGPGADFFESLRSELGRLPFVVEDLGFLDPGLAALRDRFGFPSMRVPLYADWCAERHEHKPRDFPRDAIAYTSTHDTDTVAGYYADLDPETRGCMDYAIGTDGDRPAWDLLEAVWDSGAVLAMTTVPDLLGLGSEARLNTPGTAEGNWRWRVESDALTEDIATELAAVTERTRR